MRSKCKYEHTCLFHRYVDGDMRYVAVNQCWAEKEPHTCNDMFREKCSKYKPDDNIKLSWISTDKFDKHYGYVYKCAICGKKIIGTSNYCPQCGHEYKPWDSKKFN